jgi:hypothetical protein
MWPVVLRVIFLLSQVGYCGTKYQRRRQELDGHEKEFLEMDTDEKTISVPVAGKRYFNLGRNASYQAARRGQLPVIQIGGRLRVPVVALEQMLLSAGISARR